MKYYILGANGMMGSMFTFVCKSKDLDYYPIYRNEFDVLKNNMEELNNIIKKTSEFSELIIIFNFIGCIPQKQYQNEDYIKINQEFPHLLADMSNKNGYICVHLSTNCVFSGKRGNYIESDIPDTEELYGITKYKGEPDNCVVIRTSIIGPERNSSSGLFSWLLNSHDDIPINGFLNHSWNGVTTLELSKYILENIDYFILNNSKKIHIFSDTHSKYELLLIIKQIFSKKVNIDCFMNKETKNCTLSSEILRPRKNIMKQILDIKKIYNIFMNNEI